MRLLKSEKPAEGTLVTAAEQTLGRGQQGSTWYSRPGRNITASIILRPVFLDPGYQFLLSSCISLGIRDVIKELLGQGRADITVKWPNDIYVGDRKIAGILIENTIRGNRIAHTVAGFGLNVNQEDFPANAGNAVSLRQLTGKQYDLAECLSSVCRAIESYYLKLRNGGQDAIAQAYHDALYRRDEWHTYKVRGEQLEARITGVSRYGYLVVESGHGETHTLDVKEVEYF